MIIPLMRDTGELVPSHTHKDIVRRQLAQIQGRGPHQKNVTKLQP